MSLQRITEILPMFVLAFFRIAGMMTAAPLFSSARLPQRVKLLMALVMTVGLLPDVPAPAGIPADGWTMAVALAGEMIFGLAIGTALSFVFVAMHWAGVIIGQQMGLGLGEMFDPRLGQTGSPVADLYFLLAMVIFLISDGHHAFLRGLRESFQALPLLSIAMGPDLLSLVGALLQSATMLALQLAGPMLVAMILTDVVLGFLGKTVPQVNVITAGLSLRALLGMLVLILGAVMTSSVIREGIGNSLSEISRVLTGGG